MQQTDKIIQEKDRTMEVFMGKLLQSGVLLSAVTVLIGAFIYIKRHGIEKTSYTLFTGEPKRLTEITAIWQTAIEGSGRSIIQLGLLLLIATPITRIVFSIIGFLMEKDYLYVIITIIVLAIIIFNL